MAATGPGARLYGKETEWSSCDDWFRARAGLFSLQWYVYSLLNTYIICMKHPPTLYLWSSDPRNDSLTQWWRKCLSHKVKTYDFAWWVFIFQLCSLHQWFAYLFIILTGFFVIVHHWQNQTNIYETQMQCTHQPCSEHHAKQQYPAVEVVPLENDADNLEVAEL